MVQKGQDLEQAFHDLHDSVHQAIDESEARIKAYAENASQLAHDLAALNAEVSVSNDPTLQDRRDKVAGELAQLTGGRVLESDHGYRFMLDDGSVLVDGNRAAKVEAVPDAALGGHSRIEVVDGGSRRNVTGSVGGKLAGQLDLRDRIAPGLGDQIDQLAFDLASDVNAVHSANAGLDGVTGRSFFTQPGSVAGAAQAFTVDPTIAADPRLVAAADPNLGSGDNSGLAGIASLADRFSDAAIGVLSNLGQEVAGAQRNESMAQAKSDTLSSLRDSLSGVSIEEEMSRLSEFQRAAEASLQFVQTIDGMLEEMIHNL